MTPAFQRSPEPLPVAGRRLGEGCGFYRKDEGSLRRGSKQVGSRCLGQVRPSPRAPSRPWALPFCSRRFALRKLTSHPMTGEVAAVWERSSHPLAVCQVPAQPDLNRRPPSAPSPQPRRPSPPPAPSRGRPAATPRACLPPSGTELILWEACGVCTSLPAAAPGTCDPGLKSVS